LFVTPIRQRTEHWWVEKENYANWRWIILIGVYVGVFYWSLAELLITSYSPFIYFKF